MAAYTVIFDACVLYPAPLRDLLVQLATTDLFRAKWTNEIHEEWIRNVLANRADLTREQLERTKALMDEAVLDCLIEGYEHLIPSITLPDEGDRHVVAAALHARADAIVTSNLKDFPPDTLRGYNLEALHPDDFITYQFDLREADVVVAAQTCRNRLKRKPLTVAEYLATLEQLALPKTVAALLPYATVL